MSRQKRELLRKDNVKEQKQWSSPAFPWLQVVRMQQISMSQVKLEKAPGLIKLPGPTRKQRGCQVKTGLELWEREGRKERQVEKSVSESPASVIVRWEQISHGLPKNDTCVWKSNTGCLPQRACTTGQCYVLKYSQQWKCTKEVKRLFPVFAMPPPTTINGVIGSRKKGKVVGSWKCNTPWFSMGRREGDEIEVLNWTRLVCTF